MNSPSFIQEMVSSTFDRMFDSIEEDIENEKQNFARTDMSNYIGETVQLENLKKQELNQEFGRVIGWDEVKERYHVLLCMDQSIKLIKPANLLHIPMEIPKEVMLFVCSDDHMNVQRGKELFQNVENNRTVFCWKLNWYIKLREFYRLSPRDLKKILKMVEKMMKNCDVPDLLAGAKFLWCKILLDMHPTKYKAKVKPLLLEMTEHHYGYLPQIMRQFFFLFPNELCERDPKLMAIYEEAKVCIINKTYVMGARGACVDQVFCACALRFFGTFWDRLESIEIKEEMDFLYERLSQYKPETHMLSLIALSEYSYLEGNYEDSLEKIIKFHDWKARTDGATRIMIDIYELKTRCYAKLGNKKMAKRCLKRYYKHMGEKNPEAGFLEKMISQIPDDEGLVEEKEKRKARAFEKCAYPMCEKIESKKEKFKACSACMQVRYCSKKCQKKHWHAGHKNICTDYLCKNAFERVGQEII